jgi:hypothetical protein
MILLAIVGRAVSQVVDRAVLRTQQFELMLREVANLRVLA